MRRAPVRRAAARRAPLRRAAAIAATAAALGGCFSTWSLSQVGGNAKIWDEQVREEKVPLAGITERLTVTLPLIVEMAAAVPATMTEPYKPPAPLPLRLRCKADQTGKDAVYHSAFRYGRSWKRGAGVMFVIEAAAAASIWLLGDQDGSDLFWGTPLAADALGTGVIFFLPRKEIYRRDIETTRTPFREDCPETLTLSIGQDNFAIDAAGSIDEVGEVALDDWMQSPSGPLLLTLDGRSHEVVLDETDRCTWNRARQRSCPGVGYGAMQQYTQTVIEVTPGTLTRAEE